MGDDTFCKRSGTTDVGKDYEDLLIADLVLQLLLAKTVKNFKLSSNDKSFGAFDDVVVETESNTKNLYAIQLKHVSKDYKTLSLESLKSEKGNFTIKKYYESFKSIKPCNTPCKFILFTNLKFDKDEAQIQINTDGDKYITAKITKVESKELFSNGLCYKFEIDSNTENTEYKEFFDKFLLYTNQLNVEDTKASIKSKFLQVFSCSNTDCERFMQFIAQWSLQEGVKTKLSRNMVQKIIVLTVLHRFIKPLSFEYTNDKMISLRGAIDTYHITFAKKDAYHKLKLLWSDLKHKLINENDKKTLKVARNFQLVNYEGKVQEMNDTDISKLLWLLGMCPLIVNKHQTTCNVISLCCEEKFILIGSGRLDEQISTSTIFQNLSDLDPNFAIYQNIVSTFKCLLQGKEDVSLHSLIQKNENIRTVVTINDLVKMLDGPYPLGEAKEVIPDPYIPRILTVNHIDINYLKNVDKDTVIVLDCMNKLDKIKSRLGNFNLIDIMLFLRDVKNSGNVKSDSNHKSLYHTSPCLQNFVSGSDVYITEECSHEDFDKICRRNSNFQRYHHLKIVDETTFEWIRSKGDVSDLDRYRREVTFIEETKLYRHKPANNVNLVNGDPGMGKSELLKNIKNNRGVECWGVFFQSMDIALLCTRLEKTQPDHKEQELIKFIVETMYDGYPDFDKEVIKLLLEKHQVAYFWDALDEISTKNIEIVTDLILELSQKSSFQWITSRCHLKQQLEKTFNVLSRSLSQFTEEEQALYIHKRLKDLLPDEDIDEVIEKIRSAVTLVKHNDVLGTPLQVFMLTELFRQDHVKYDDLLNKLFSLTDLYQHIIDEKFNRYYKVKADVRSPNDILKQVLVDHKRSMLEKYEKAGLKALIQKEVFRHLNINCDDFLDDIQNRADSIGLITEVTDKFPQFLHNSYAEFFVAKYFAEHYKEIEDFKKIIFDSRYVNVRFFFDLLTAKNSSAHIAVLYKNIDLLKQHKDDLMDCEDTGGRNVLQLACSWGQRCPTLDVEKRGEIYVVDNNNDDLSHAETSEYTEMLQYLLDTCDASEADDIFNGTSLAYAEKADCLMAKLKLLLKYNSSRLKNDNEGISILYYCAKFGYEEVIDLFDKVPFVKTKKGGFSLLHLAVNYSHVKFLKKLLCVDGYKTSIDDRDQNGETPLYEACQNGYYNLAVLLVDHGANINAGTHEGSTPLHTACLHLHTNIVKFLLKSGGNVNITKNFGIAPLHVACWNGHYDVVDILLQNGADINLPAHDGCTPLYIASRNRHDKVASLLLKHGADIDLAQEDGATALFIACQEGHEKNVEVLLGAKADVECVTKSGESPLYIACQNGHEGVVRMLVKSGVDVNVAAGNGFMPIHIACQQGYAVIVELLIEAGAGAKVECCEYCMTPLEVARIHGHDNLVALLHN